MGLYFGSTTTSFWGTRGAPQKRVSIQWGTLLGHALPLFGKQVVFHIKEFCSMGNIFGRQVPRMFRKGSWVYKYALHEKSFVSMGVHFGCTFLTLQQFLYVKGREGWREPAWDEVPTSAARQCIPLHQLDPAKR